MSICARNKPGKLGRPPSAKEKREDKSLGFQSQSFVQGSRCSSNIRKIKHELNILQYFRLSPCRKLHGLLNGTESSNLDLIFNNLRKYILLNEIGNGDLWHHRFA
ncbi:hypothetical protein PUN28_009309 [Cardiocondyla obscurior]|uniref:Uncharacterized protein n=1 Tax=Cardiocondyla obscurior TaxID=286306 RepID=A0AAW2FRE8_9HYME